jgi:hypothetical protein
MDSSTLAPNLDVIESYIHDLKITEMICVSKRILILYLMLVSVISNSKKMIKHLRLQLSQSENTHEKLKAEIRQIRDEFVKLHELSVQSRFVVKPVRYLLEKAAIDWDDFVEECTVSSDAEIKDLLQRVNNAI